MLLERAAERDLKRLSSREFSKVIAAIRALAEHPRPRGCRKISSSEHDWRIRVGPFRVLYEIDDKAKIVRVMRVRRRPKAYML
ncbi:MAG: type II toxin-antitoxin system RelE/ParE family toxin [Candidatus Bipolaricaulota bacterium]|nr:type II toxin-antitoxin system RelE/ParE family toxin [Candidatus Bipolaricaulota bacterium]MCS7274123.1 type II toxin-antitoxin system RelE/ParE family toxin [Candidatus Bipolaricaulota bacterium]MDW8111296.1 type II toxin-antitoxin system RelE/ParE family toxin [Candidatus Bipolaricaulota bacterium]